MAGLWYFVLVHQGKWMISFQHDYYGPFPTRQEAIETAIDWAQVHGLAGHHSQVVLQEEGDFEIQWTYGTDPYPPSK